MKTIFRNVLIASTVLFFVACSKDDEGDPIEESVVPLEFTCAEISDLMETNYTFEDRGPGIDYIIPCTINISGDVKIAPGVTIAMKTEVAINVNETGSLNAIGTAAKPILITSTELTKGDWKGILFDSNDNKNILEYVTISYAGSGSHYGGNPGTIVLAPDSQLTMNNCTITDSKDKGINLVYGSQEVSIINTTITRCTLPIQARAQYISSIVGGSYVGNETDRIRVLGHQTEVAGTWTKHDVPYRIFETVRLDEVVLTIAPGVILEFENGAGITVDDDNGALNAEGTAAEPILFTAMNKAPGAWKGLKFEFTSSPLNKIKNATIEYAGDNYWDWEDGAIHCWSNPRVWVENVLIKDTDGCAIKHSITNPTNMTIINVTSQNNNGNDCTLD